MFVWSMGALFVVTCSKSHAVQNVRMIKDRSVKISWPFQGEFNFFFYSLLHNWERQVAELPFIGGFNGY